MTAAIQGANWPQTSGRRLEGADSSSAHLLPPPWKLWELQTLRSTFSIRPVACAPVEEPVERVCVNVRGETWKDDSVWTQITAWRHPPHVNTAWMLFVRKHNCYFYWLYVMKKHTCCLMNKLIKPNCECFHFFVFLFHKSLTNGPFGRKQALCSGQNSKMAKRLAGVTWCADEVTPCCLTDKKKKVSGNELPIHPLRFHCQLASNPLSFFWPLLLLLYFCVTVLYFRFSGLNLSTRQSDGVQRQNILQGPASFSG